MHTARQAPIRAFVASLAVLVPLIAGASSASGAIVINEVESQPTDFVELYNTGAVPVDIGGFTIDDNNPGGATTIPGGTMIAAGGFYVENAPPSLGNPDEVHLFDTTPVEVDTFSYLDHAANTYGRCPDGTGQFNYTFGATPNAANNCPAAPSIWPGGTTISIADAVDAFGAGEAGMSGLAYQPSGSSAPGVLWAVKNNPGTLYRLVWNGSIWTPDTANGWSGGKALRYTNGLGNPDAEGVTLAGGDTNGIYVATERDGDNSGVSRPAVLRFDVSGAGEPLTATNDFNLTGNLPGLDANGGLETVTWIPDAFLVSQGFFDELAAAPYNPAAYPNHGSGLFFVGVEQTGQVIAYALNPTGDAFARIATIVSGSPSVMALDYEAETGHLWAFCDDTCFGESKTLDIAQSGVNDGKFVATAAYARPSGMANLNNEGVAITPQAECVNNRKPVIYADDFNTATHSLRQGTIACTPLPGGGGGGGGGTDDTTPPETKIDSGPKKKTTKKKAKFTFSANEPATFRCKLDKGAFAACTSPATFKAKKKGKHTLQVVAVDAAGNADATPASLSWKLKAKKKK